MYRLNRIKGWQIYDYYQWILDKIRGYAEPYFNYSLLLCELHSIEFTYGIMNDENRAIDGVNLRHEYMDEQNVPDIFYHDSPCSVLEMMVGLAVRVDREIMRQPGADNSYQWFWMMIDNLDLSRCTDEHFSSEYVRQQIGKWLGREFQRNGVGSPFPLKIKNCQDQRKQTIWAQMCGYLSENF